MRRAWGWLLSRLYRSLADAHRHFGNLYGNRQDHWLAIENYTRAVLHDPAYAQAYYLGARRKGSLTATVRAFGEYLPDFFPLVHPSPLNFRWQARNPWFEHEVIPRLRERVREVLEGSGNG